MNVNLWSVDHKKSIDANFYFAILSIACWKRTESFSYIFVFILMCIWMILKRMMIFFSLCVQKYHWKCSTNCKKSWICECGKYWMGKMCLYFPREGDLGIHIFGSIFKLNYWISSIWSNMHMYSSITLSLFIVYVQCSYRFVVVACNVLYVCMAWTQFFRGESVHL